MLSSKYLILFTIFIIAIISAVLFLTYFKQPQDYNTKALNTTKNLAKSNQILDNPYFVETMRQREYKASEVKIEKTLGIFGNFNSYLASYTSEGLKIFTLLNIPTSQKPDGGFPVVIVNHGYINPSSYSTTNSYKTIADFFASNGFLVLKPDYRGHGNSEGQTGALGRLNYAVDVLNLIASIPNLQDANSDKIFIYGHSMGGEVSLRVLEVTDKIKAATLWAPAATDYPETLLYFVRRHRPEILSQIEAEISANFKKENFAKISSLDNTQFINTKINIHHGTSDDSVPYDWSVKLDQKLTQTKAPHTFYTYPLENHNFTRGAWSMVTNRDLQLFKKYL